MRVLVLWCVDWPVVAAAGQVPDVDPATVPVAVLTANRVVACSATARVEGVRRGQRKREAQARCPGLVTLPRDLVAEVRAYEPVVTAIEALAPGVEVVRPGLCAVRATGPARYFGGEEAAAARLAGTVLALGIECYAGVADGIFAATLAARHSAKFLEAHNGEPPGGRPSGEYGAEFQQGRRSGKRGGGVQQGRLTGEHGGGVQGSRPPGEHGREFRESHPPGHSTVVSAGRTAEFLAPFPVDALDRPELADLLRRLGIRTLGAFAALPAREVLARFGLDGALAHRLAGGADDRPVAARRPPTDLAVRRELDPPVNRVDTAAFHAKAAAEELVAGLAARGLVCSSVDISVQDHAGEWLSRRWRHDRAMSAHDLADRARWQIESWLRDMYQAQASAQLPSRRAGADPRPRSDEGADLPASAETDAPADDDDGYERPHGITVLRLEPVEAFPAGKFPTALWGGPGEHDERARRVVNRVYSLLGAGGVLVPVVAGGRGPADVVELIPWGDERSPSRPADRPWPGRLPSPSPAVIPRERTPVVLLDAGGTSVTVDGHSGISAPPATLAVDTGPPAAVTGWAGPWPVDERWWDRSTAWRGARLQVSTDFGAWLLAFTDDRWWVEAAYE